MKMCSCGCGTEVAHDRDDFVWGHNRRNCKHSFKTRKKMRELVKGKTFEERYGVETARRMRKNLIVMGKEKTKSWSKNGGGWFKDESREKAMITRAKNPDFGKNVAAGRKKKNPDFGKKVTRKCPICKNEFVAPVHSNKKVCSHKCRYKHWFNVIKMKPNKTELMLLALLHEYISSVWRYVGDGGLVIGRKCPDYSDGNGGLIELFGDYFHKGQNPTNKINYFKRRGYQTLVVWEHELKDTESLVQKIKDWELERYQDTVSGKERL